MTKIKLMGIGVIIIFIVGYVLFSEAHNTVDSARDIRINASDIGGGWKEFGWGYTENLSESLEEIYRTTGEREYLQMSEELRKDRVKDGSVLMLEKRVSENVRYNAEVDVYVFNDVEGANVFFEYMKNKNGGSIIPDIGDRAISVRGNALIVRVSNVVFEVVAHGSEEQERRKIAEIMVERIVKKRSD